MKAAKKATAPTVLMSLVLVANNQTLSIALGGNAPTPEQAALMATYLERGCYLTVEFMSDGTARIEPIAA